MAPSIERRLTIGALGVATSGSGYFEYEEASTQNLYFWTDGIVTWQSWREGIKCPHLWKSITGKSCEDCGITLIS